MDGTPIDVRFIGKVTSPEGLTEYDSVNNGGTEGDNGHMARMKDASNVTIEGVGYDATIDGWGFTLCVLVHILSMAMALRLEILTSRIILKML